MLSPVFLLNKIRHEQMQKPRDALLSPTAIISNIYVYVRLLSNIDELDIITRFTQQMLN